MVQEGERTADHISTCPTGSTAAGHPVCSPQPPKIAPRVVHAASNTAPNTPNSQIFPNAFGVVTAPWGKRAAQRALSARAARGWVCELQLPPRRLLGAGSRAFGQNPPAAGARRACRQQRCGGAALGGAAGPRSAPAPRRLPAPGGCAPHPAACTKYPGAVRRAEIPRVRTAPTLPGSAARLCRSWGGRGGAARPGTSGGSSRGAKPLGPRGLSVPTPVSKHPMEDTSLVCLNQNKPTRYRTNFSQIFRLFAFRVLGGKSCRESHFQIKG